MQKKTSFEVFKMPGLVLDLLWEITAISCLMEERVICSGYVIIVC